MDFDCWEWTAVQDNTPGPDEFATLTINGMCGKFPTDGFRLELVQRRGGINPWEPFFDLVVQKPEEAPDVLCDEPASHTMKVRRDTKYTKVSIFYDDAPRWTVEVDQVS